MEIQEYLTKQNKLQYELLNFLDSNDLGSSNFTEVEKLIGENNIRSKRQELCALLNLISNISMNHHRTPDFFNKIEQILLFCELEIKQNFSIFKIFDIFKSNKRILLFLIEKKIIIPNNEIADFISRDKYQNAFYSYYFFPEFETFFKDNTKISEVIKEQKIDNFEEKRKIGENDQHLCYLIRNDMIDEFTSFFENESFSNSTKIEPSIFETNTFLMSKTPTLIEYAVFFGSTNIFHFLLSKNANLTPSLIKYAVHGRNLEIIQHLRFNFKQKDDIDKTIFIEAVKCHHNEIAEYVKNNMNTNQSIQDEKILLKCLKFYNYSYFPDLQILYKNEFVYCLCEYNFAYIVEFLMNTKDSTIDVNFQIVLNIFLIQFKIFFFY